MSGFRLHNVLFLFIALCIILSSCSIAKKNKEKRIIGTWNVINVIDPDETVLEQWTFDADGKVYRLSVDDTSITVLDEGEWALEQKVNTAYVNTIFGTEASEQAGLSVNWEILKLKKKTMTVILSLSIILRRIESIKIPGQVNYEFEQKVKELNDKIYEIADILEEIEALGVFN